MIEAPQGPERLQKILARAGVGSRRQVEDLIREGRVSVNGRPAELGQRADLSADAVRVDGKRIHPPQGRRIYLLINKPVSVVSTRSDPEGRPTVLDLVPARFHRGLVTVGRLDYDSEGLLLLTSDGQFAQRVAHPRHGCIKHYEVKVKGYPPEGSIDRLRDGVVIDGRRTAPARIEAMGGMKGSREAVSNSWWRVSLGEGRPRQIREMFHRIGHPVARLRRVAIGPVSSGQLGKGGWRELTPEEVEALLDASDATQAKARTLARRPDRAGGGRASAPKRGAKARRGEKGRHEKDSHGKRAGAPRPPGRGKDSSRDGRPRRGGPGAARAGSPGTRGGDGGGRDGGRRDDGRPGGARGSGPKPGSRGTGGRGRGGRKPGGRSPGGRSR